MSLRDVTATIRRKPALTKFTGLVVDAFSQESAYYVHIHIKNDLKMKPIN